MFKKKEDMMKITNPQARAEVRLEALRQARKHKKKVKGEKHGY